MSLNLSYMRIRGLVFVKSTDFLSWTERNITGEDLLLFWVGLKVAGMCHLLEEPIFPHQHHEEATPAWVDQDESTPRFDRTVCPCSASSYSKHNILIFLIRTSRGCPSVGAETGVEVNGVGGTTRCTFFPRSLRTSSWSTLPLAGDLKCVHNPLQEHKAQGAASGLEIFLVRRDERSWTDTNQGKKMSGVYDCV